MIPSWKQMGWIFKNIWTCVWNEVECIWHLYHCPCCFNTKREPNLEALGCIWASPVSVYISKETGESKTTWHSRYQPWMDFSAGNNHKGQNGTRSLTPMDCIHTINLPALMNATLSAEENVVQSKVSFFHLISYRQQESALWQGMTIFSMHLYICHKNHTDEPLHWNSIIIGSEKNSSKWAAAYRSKRKSRSTLLYRKVGKGVRAQTHNVRGTQGLFNTENNTSRQDKRKTKLGGLPLW